MVSLTVSTGLGVSVFAGILSGLVYVLTQGIKQRKQYVFSKIFLRNFFSCIIIQLKRKNSK